MLRMTVLLAAAVTAGCATTMSEQAMRVQPAAPEQVEGCDYLGTAKGTSGFGNLASSVGMENAKNEVREKAADMGATNVVWLNVSGGFASSAAGRVYDCS